MATALGDFINMVVAVKRGGSGQKELEFDSIKMNVNKMDISFATQLYIDGKFVNATSGKKLDVYNPHDESLVCQVESAGLSDVDKVTNQYYYTNDQSNHCLNKIRQI
jgi:formyltetrahydrofolate dehydrogenase